jgi:hypothetical protein
MEQLFKKINLSNIINIESVDSSQNSVFKITTEDNTYLVKEYSNDAIKTEDDLNKRIKQINLSKILNNSGIPTIIPIAIFNNSLKIIYIILKSSQRLVILIKKYL